MQGMSAWLRATFTKATIPPLAAGLTAGALAASVMGQSESPGHQASDQTLRQPIGAYLTGSNCRSVALIARRDGPYTLHMPPDGGCVLFRPGETFVPAFRVEGRECDQARIHLGDRITQLTIPASADCRLHIENARPIVDRKIDPAPS